LPKFPDVRGTQLGCCCLQRNIKIFIDFSPKPSEPLRLVRRRDAGA
jgi:hypothetical protein